MRILAVLLSSIAGSPLPVSPAGEPGGSGDVCYVKNTWSVELSTSGSGHWRTLCPAELGTVDSIVMRGDRGLICIDDEALRRVGPDTRTLWERPLPYPGELRSVHLLPDHGLVLCVFGTGQILSLDDETGDPLASALLATSGGCSGACLDLAGDTLYVASNTDDRLHALRIGREALTALWSVTMRRRPSGGPAGLPFGRSWIAQGTIIREGGRAWLALAAEPRGGRGRCRLAQVSLGPSPEPGLILAVHPVGTIRHLRRLMSAGGRCLLLGRSRRWSLREAGPSGVSKVDLGPYRRRRMEPADAIVEGTRVIVAFLPPLWTHAPANTKWDPPPIHVALFDASPGGWALQSSSVFGRTTAWWSTYIARNDQSAAILQRTR